MLAALTLLPVLAQTLVERISIDHFGSQQIGNANYVDLSADGRFVVFQDSGQLTASDTNAYPDCYLLDRTTGLLELVSLDYQGAVSSQGGERPRVSNDGRFVVFQSRASDLTSTGDGNTAFDVYVRDRQLGRTLLASVLPGGGTGVFESVGPDISGDGRYVVFESGDFSMAPAGYFLGKDVLRRDLVLGTTELVSVGLGGANPNGASSGARISADGRRVSFESWASNLVTGDLNGTTDTFVRDFGTLTTLLASQSTAGLQVTSQVSGSSISDSGEHVLFNADSLVPGDTNGVEDVYLRDLTLGVTERVSTDSLGRQLSNYSLAGSVSPDGRFVAFESWAADVLGSGPGLPASNQVYVKDRLSDTTYLISASPSGGYADDYAGRACLSAQGDVIAFESLADNLVPGDTDGLSDAYVGRAPLAGARLLPDPSRSGGPLQVQLSQATPSSQVLLAFSSGSYGTLPTAFGLAHIGPGPTLVALPTDATGAFGITIPLPSLPGLVLAAQGLDVGSLSLTSADVIELQ